MPRYLAEETTFHVYIVAGIQTNKQTKPDITYHLSPYFDPYVSPSITDHICRFGDNPFGPHIYNKCIVSQIFPFSNEQQAAASY